MTDSDVLAKWGDPQSVERDLHFCVQNETCEYWNYNASNIFIYEGKVMGLSSSSSERCLWDTLCTGDSIETAYNLLGETKIWPPSKDKPALLNYFDKNNEAACWLWVYLNQAEDMVAELRLVCQP